MKIHDLKTDWEMWQAVAHGEKTAEFRRDDRGYAVGDVLRLFDPYYPSDALHALERVVTHIVRGPAYGIPEGYAMLSFRIATDADIEALIDSGNTMLGGM